MAIMNSQALAAVLMPFSGTLMASFRPSSIAFSRASISSGVFFGIFIAAMYALNAFVSLSIIGIISYASRPSRTPTLIRPSRFLISTLISASSASNLRTPNVIQPTMAPTTPHPPRARLRPMPMEDTSEEAEPPPGAAVLEPSTSTKLRTEREASGSLTSSFTM